MILAYKLNHGRQTTTGTPNPRTGKLSIAHDIEFFICEESAKKHGFTKISKKELRKLNLGISVADFNDLINYKMLEFDYDLPL